MTPQEELVREVARGMAEMASVTPHGFDGGPDSWEPYAKAAIAIVVERVGQHLSAVQYDPAPYTALKYRLRALAEEQA